MNVNFVFLLNTINKLVAAMLLVLFFIISPVTLAKDVPGSTETSYGVSPNGAFQFQIPILIPQGRNGIQPNLRLSFSSSSRNGMAGVGWNVSGLGAITRCGRTIATNGITGGVLHDQNDRFCLNGQQLILVSGGYGQPQSEYRTEIEQFSRIMAVGDFSVNVNGGRAPSYWKVWRKDGRIELYGQGPATTQKFRLPGTNSVHTWPLTSVADRSGNEYKVFYRGNQEGFPSNIKYSYGNGLTTEQEVLYHYEARPDTRFRYVVGRKITIAERLKRIEVKNKGVTVREYYLDYADNDAAFNGIGVEGESRLAAVTECGMNNECMPPINIEWQAQTAGYQLTSNAADKSPDDLIQYYTFTRQLGGGNTEPNSVKQIDRGQWVDINGDGRVDQIISLTRPNGADYSRAYIKVNGEWEEQQQWRLPHTLRNYDDAITNSTTGRFASGVINKGLLVDVNGDGLVDVVYSYTLRPDNHQTGPVETFQKTYLNTGNGWQPSAAYAPKDILFDYTSNGAGLVHVQTVRGQFIDINRDGLTDWVTAYYDYTSNGNGNEYKKTWLNNGNGWTYTPDYNLPDVFVQYRGVYSLPHGQFVDVNGDGLQDWVQSYQASLENPTRNTWLNTGSGWQQDNSYNLPDTVYSNINGWNNNAPLTRGRFIDVNGDGLRDWVRSYETVGGVTSTATIMNTGNGWVTHAGYKPPFIYWNHRYSDFERGWPLNVRGFHIDLNRDGLVDYVESYKSSATGFPVSKQAWINTGSDWELQPASSPYIPVDLYFDYSGRDNARSQFGQWLDINNDGAADWVRSRAGVTKRSRLANTSRANQVASIATNLGVIVKPTFLPLTDNDELYTKVPTDGETNQPLAAEVDSLLLASPLYVTAKLETSRPDAPTSFNATEYRYAGLQAHRRGRGSQGFYQLTVIDNQKGIVSTSQRHQVFPLTGAVKKQYVSVGNVVLEESNNSYQFTEIDHIGGKSYFTYLDQADSITSELNDGNAIRKTHTERTYGDFGNLDQQITEVRSGVTNSTLLRRTVTEVDYFAPNMNDWLIGLVENNSVSVSSDSQALVQSNKSAYTYDSLGRVLIVTREPDSQDDSIKLVTSLTYDSVGNVIEGRVVSTESGAIARVNTQAYDQAKRLVSETVNAEGHATQATYHPQCDALVKYTDANGVQTEVEYDAFCRQTKVSSLDNIETTTTYEQGVFACASCQTTPVYKSTTTSTGETPITTFANEYLQAMLSTTLGMDGDVIEQVTEYDRFGRVSRSSQPVFSGDAYQWTNYQYDILDRHNQIILPFNNTNNVAATLITHYFADASGRLVRQNTDAEGRTTTAYANGLGQIDEIVDANNSSMQYRYDAKGNLIQTLDAANNQIEIGYDILNRRISLNDPDLGLTSYTYDAFNDLRQQVDAKGQAISMSYDRLGRLTQRAVPNHSNGTDISQWVYDSEPNGIGALAAVNGPAGSGYAKTYKYDVFSRLIEQATTVDGQSYKQGITYDATTGFILSRRFPDSGVNTNGEANTFEIHYSYRNGYLSLITDRKNNVPGCIEHWRADKYDALGRIEQDTLGRLVTSNRVFDQGQGVLKSIQSTLLHGDQSTVQDLNYSYDGVNNLLTRSDSLASINESFEYDNLDRLRFHHHNLQQTTEVRYDAIGNITYKSNVGHYDYSGSGGPHAVSRINSDDGLAATIPSFLKFVVNWEFDAQQVLRSQPQIHNQDFQYDVNGNITQYGDRSFWWTAFDKPYRIERVDNDLNATVASDFEYDPEFNRLTKREYRKTNPNNSVETTIYIGKQYERITDGQGNTKHRYFIRAAGNTVQIERQDNTDFDEPKYFLSDNLGSTNVILNALGEVEQRLAFDPWGMRVDTDSTSVNSITNRGYTGHEMDDELGLTNMNARIYDPYLGRFLSVDPVLPDPTDMQQYNRYSYVLNNPLKYTDPTGNSGVPICSSEQLDGSENINTGCAGSSPGAINPIRPITNPNDIGDIITDELFGNIFLTAYADESGSALDHATAIFAENVAELEAILDNPDTRLETLESILNFLNEFGGQSRQYNGLAEQFQSEISLRLAGLSGAPALPLAAVPEARAVRGNAALGTMQFAIREATLGVVFGEHGKLGADFHAAANIEAFENSLGPAGLAILPLIGLRKESIDALINAATKGISQRIALGKSIGLDEFAASQSARTLMKDPNFLGTISTELRAGTKFSVDLSGVGGNIDGALTRAATGRGSPFDLEILEIRNFLKEGGNAKKIDFFLNGEKVANPF